MKRGWTRVAVVIGALVVAIPALRAVAYVRAGRTLDAYVASHGDAVAAERARRATTRLPARHGPPTAVHCSDAQAFIGHENFDDAPPDIAASMDAWPATHATALARSWIQPRTTKLDELRATLGCLHTLAESDTREPMRVIHRLTRATHAVIVDGMVHAEDGDAAGAIERVLDAIRLAEQGDATIASSLIDVASLALARVVASTRSGDELEEITRALDALEPFVPASTASADEMKRLLVDAARDTDPEPFGTLDAPVYETVQGTQRARMRLAVLLLPKRAIVASAVTDIDAQLDRAIDALRSGSSARAREVEQTLDAENASTTNPIVWLTAAPMTIYFGRSIVRAACAMAVARATVAIERTRDASGHYAAPTMPEDPCAHGTPLRFELTSGGAGYRVWSVGGNGKDDNGRHVISTDAEHDDDLVAIRSPINL